MDKYLQNGQNKLWTKGTKLDKNGQMLSKWTKGTNRTNMDKMNFEQSGQKVDKMFYLLFADIHDQIWLLHQCPNSIRKGLWMFECIRKLQYSLWASYGRPFLQ